MQPILSLKSVSKSFPRGFRGKEHQVLNEVSLDVGEGQIIALVGQNGAGKSTVLRCCTGELEPKKGSVQLQGTLGYLPDSPAMLERATGGEWLESLWSIAWLKRQEARSRSRKFAQKLDLLFAYDRLICEYSKGMKQRLGMIASLMHEPKCLVRDEPMSDIDPLGRVCVKEFMQELRSQGVVILFSTHILADVHDIADYVYLLHQGRIVAEQAVNQDWAAQERFVHHVKLNGHTHLT